MAVESLGWISVGAVADAPPTSIGTLGPAGTSSEQAANLLWRRRSAGDSRITLHDGYEDAAESLLAGRVSHFVVANAYRNVNVFYMDTRLALDSVFIMDTPLYGLAKPHGTAELPESPTIATHPSPMPLIKQLLPAGYTPGEITVMPSTSAAAIAVKERVTDLALTTEVAAKAHGLAFISRTRPIRMVWSVFTRNDD